MSGGHEKRLFLFFIVVAVVLYLQYLFIDQPKQEAARQAALEQDAAIEAGEAPAFATQAPQESLASGTNAAGTDAAATTTALPLQQGQLDPSQVGVQQSLRADAVVTTTVLSGGVSYTFSNEGASLIGVELLDYLRVSDEEAPVVLLDREPNGTDPLTFGLLFTNPQTTVEARQGLYVPLHGDEPEVLEDGTQRLRYGLTTSTGLAITKQFDVPPDGYEVKVSYILGNPGQQTMALGAPEVLIGNNVGMARGGLMDMNIVTQQQLSQFGASYSVAGSVESEDFKEKRDVENFIFGPGVEWSGITLPYFFVALRPGETVVPASEVRVERREARIFMYWKMNEVVLPPGGEHLAEFFGFFGPQKIEVLEQNPASYSEVINFGWFGFLARPLFTGLQFFYSYTRNYGFAIMLLTLSIRFVLLAFTYRSMMGMQKMQEVQPKVAALRKKYEKDPQKLNQEIMALYKEEGVNPVASCLPMLLQIPIFFTLYNLLFTSIELRHAPFLLWIQDLSAPDPIYVLPLVMGFTTYLQGALMPMGGGDPNMAAQQKMIKYFLPVMLTFVSWRFPTGLVVYWITNNLFTIIQQFTFRKLGIIKTPPQAPAPANAAPSSGSAPASKKSKKRKK